MGSVSTSMCVCAPPGLFTLLRAHCSFIAQGCLQIISALYTMMGNINTGLTQALKHTSTCKELPVQHSHLLI